MTFCLIVSLWSGWRESQVRQARFANEGGSMTVGKRCLGKRGFLCAKHVCAKCGMIYGYAQVSTDGQSVEAQVRQLIEAGRSRVFRETASGAKTDRTRLQRGGAGADLLLGVFMRPNYFAAS